MRTLVKSVLNDALRPKLTCSEKRGIVPSRPYNKTILHLLVVVRGAQRRVSSRRQRRRHHSTAAAGRNRPRAAKNEKFFASGPAPVVISSVVSSCRQRTTHQHIPERLYASVVFVCAYAWYLTNNVVYDDIDDQSDLATTT